MISSMRKEGARRAYGPVDVWRSHLTIFVLACILLLSLYWSTVQSLVYVWWSDDTYGHGFLIFPISLYLIYQDRHRLAAMRPSFQFGGVLLAALLSVCWVISATLHIALAQQVLLVGFVMAIVWAILGWRIFLKILFPLLFLFFSIPIWDLMVTTTLQGITAKVSAVVLTLFGVPILAEGHFITIPEGVFQVETTCAGTRYFVACLILSVLFVHIAYSNYYKKALFLFVAIVVSIAVNCVRVIAVILAGHLTDMRHPWVHDHIAMGWWLFMAFIVPMFWIGMRYMDPPDDGSRGGGSGSGVLPMHHKGNEIWRSGVISASILGMLVLGPLLVGSTNRYSEGELDVIPPVASAAWRGPLLSSELWKPISVGADYEVMASYESSGAVVYYYSAHYFQQEQGKELVSVVNKIYDKADWQSLPGGSDVILDLGDLWPHKVHQSLIRSIQGSEEMVIWQWYSVAGRTTASKGLAKAYELLKLAGNRSESVVVSLAVSVSDPMEARHVLERFLHDMGGKINSSIKYTQ